MTTRRYSLRSANPHESFAEGEPWRAEVNGRQIEFADGVVTATSGDSANDVESALRAWQVSAYLAQQQEIWFEALDAGAHVEALFPGRDHVFRRDASQYPRPVEDFVVTAAVERLLDALRSQMSGGTDPVATAAAVLAVLDEEPADYRIDPPVVELLRDLVERGQSPDLDPYRAFRGPEWQWLQEAVRRITLQVGRARPGSPPSTALRLSDFETELEVSEKAMALQARPPG